MKRLAPETKHLALFVAAGVLVVFAAYNVFAQQPKGPMGEGTIMHKMDPNCPMGSCPMCSAMCKAMMEKALVATEDGGVILLAGCKLIKYDKDLNKVKEIELEMDPAAMQKKMQSMMMSCPMCKKMMEKREGMMMPMKGTEKPSAEHPTSEHPK